MTAGTTGSARPVREKPYRCPIPTCGELRFATGHVCHEGAADQAAVRREDV